MLGFTQTTRALGIAAVLILTAGAAYGACTVSTPCIAPPGVVGQPYSVTYFVTGGQTPYSGFSLSSGSLPPGISMTADAYGDVTFSGTPTSAVGSPFVFVVVWTDANGDPITPGDISITITGAPGPPSLYAAPGILSFQNTAGSPGTVQQSVLVQDASVGADGSVLPGSGTVAFTASVVNGSSWVSLSPASGSVTAGAPVSITVTVTTKNLKVGSYRDVIQISSPNGSYSVTVTVFATNDGPIISVGAAGVRFDIIQGSNTSLVQNVPIVNTGDPTSTVNWTASISPLGATNAPQFVVLNSPSGQANSTTPGALPIGVTGVQTLAPGAYYNLIEVADNNASNSPQYISVVLNVVAATGDPAPPPPPAPVLSPSGLVFTGTVGQTIPSQTFTVNVSTSQFQDYNTSPSLAVGQSWLMMSPASGAASSAVPATITVKVKANGLPAGIYQGLAEVGLPQGTLSVNVTLILAAVANGSVLPGPHADALSGCTPSQLIITETGIANGFTVPAGWPSNLIASLNDDCGNPVGTGSVSASFSNGDPPLTLVTQGPIGQYSATWQPQNSLATTNITLLATASGLQTGNAQITGTVAKNAAPVLSPHGIVNNWNVLQGGALAPGAWAAAYGTGLSASPQSAMAVPFPTNLQNVQLIVGGRLAPLSFVNSTQINAQIPAELTPGQQFAAVAVVNGTLTLPVTVDVVSAAPPGVLAYPDGSLVAFHGADNSYVNANSPAHPGETLVMYVEGMGATNPPVLSGNPAPTTAPFAPTVVQPTVAVDSQNAQTTYAGLTPGSVGLYQIDFVVPPTARTGSLNVVVTQGTATANQTTLPVAP